MNDANPMQMLRAADRWATWLVALAIVAVTLVGCGGGGVGVGGTGGYASGPIAGFGSVIVNGIEFDDRSARIEDEDGATLASSILRLGMRTEIDSGAISGSGDAITAVATRIRVVSDIVGLVTAVDTTANTLSVLGQTVKIAATTVFDESFTGGLAGVTIGQAVEVYAYFDPSGPGSFTATRVEPRSTAPTSYKVRGLVRNFDNSAKTFTIGGVVFNFSGVPPSGVPGTLGENSLVSVRVATTQVSGQWSVQSFGVATRSLGDLDRARVRGLITSFSSATQFSVNGQAVDASLAPAVGGLGLGVRVEAEGPVVAGVLRATKVEIEDLSGAQSGFKLKGTIGAHLPGIQVFTLRGVTVFYGAPGVQFENGSAANIATGVAVEVRGVLSSDGTRLFATRVRFGS